MRSTPSSVKRPCPSEHSAARKRIVVPEFPHIRSAAFAGTDPPVPRMRIVLASLSAVSVKHSLSSPSSIRWVSSAKSALVKVVVPSASAARTMARLVRLLEPGGAKDSENGWVIVSMAKSVMALHNATPSVPLRLKHTPKPLNHPAQFLVRQPSDTADEASGRDGSNLKCV